MRLLARALDIYNEAKFENGRLRGLLMAQEVTVAELEDRVAQLTKVLEELHGGL